MTARYLLPLVPFIALGCHGKYKKNLHKLEDVEPQVQMLSVPEVDIALSNPVDQGDSLLGAVLDTAATVGTAVEAHQLNQRLFTLLDGGDIAGQLHDSLLASSQNLPYTMGSGQDSMVIQVTSYGINVVGGTPQFFLSAKTRIYDGGTERVYKANTSCSVALGQSSAVLALVAESAAQYGALKTLEQMSDEDLTVLIDETVKGCGGKIAARLMKHAG